MKQLAYILTILCAIVALSAPARNPLRSAEVETIEIYDSLPRPASHVAPEAIPDSVGVPTEAADTVANDTVEAAPVEEEVIVSEKVVITRYLSDGTVRTDTIENQGVQKDILVSGTDPLSVRPTIPRKPKRTKMAKVTIGAELSTGLDLSGSDMSTFNADLFIGYRHKVIRMLGLSLGVHKSLGTRDSFLPIQLVFRTGFKPRPTLMFMHISAGYSFNTIARSPMFGDFIATLGCGVNLIQRPAFQSHIILAVGFRHFTEHHQEMTSITKPNLGFAQISFGVSM